MPETYASSQVLPANELITMKPRPRYSSPTASTFRSISSPQKVLELLPEAESYPPPQTPIVAPKPDPFPLSIYRSVSWMLGFKETYSLLNFFVFGGALLGYCLARSQSMNPSLTPNPNLTAPGDFFWYNLPKFRINYFIHIYTAIIGGIFVGLQFLPALRRRAVIVHRINGYFCLVCLIPGNIAGAVAGAKSFGGEINGQAAWYVAAFMITFAGLVGIINVKRQTREHRKWMLRMVSYFCIVISGKIIILIASSIVSDIGSFHSVWRCDEMMYFVADTAAEQASFPQCFGPGVDPSSTFIAVLASQNADPINAASAVRVVAGMSLWVALLIHALGVEIYIRLTDDMNRNRYGYALYPRDYDGDGQPLWTYHREK